MTSGVARPIPVDAINRSEIEKYVDKAQHCWRWTGPYRGHVPIVYIDDTWFPVSRITWTIYRGKPPPPGRPIIPRCRNNQCINPWHRPLAKPSKKRQSKKKVGDDAAAKEAERKAAIERAQRMARIERISDILAPIKAKRPWQLLDSTSDSTSDLYRDCAVEDIVLNLKEKITSLYTRQPQNWESQVLALYEVACHLVGLVEE